MNDPVLNMIGIGKKAGKICSGGFLSEDAVRNGTGRLVILATDAAVNTRKSLSDISAYYHVPLICYGTKESLGHAVGCEARAAVTVTDEGIAKKILKLTNNGGTPNGEN